MVLPDLDLPARLLACGGPGAPGRAVLRALTTPAIGQFDPDFTRIMDDVMDAARAVFKTQNVRSFAVSGTASAGVEALINTLVQPGDAVVVRGDRRFVDAASDCARRYGALVTTIDEMPPGTNLVVAPLVDADTAKLVDIAELANVAHARGARVIVDATLGLGAVNCLVDDWKIDACTAGVDYAIGAPAGMALVTYSAEVETMIAARRAPPPTSYLDLLQLQAYWSAERLNHHTAPTSLIYALREALRVLLDEGIDAAVARHHAVGAAVRAGLTQLGLAVEGDGPFAIAHVERASEVKAALLDHYGIAVAAIGPRTLRLGLFGADATLVNARRVVLAIGAILAVGVPAQ